MTFEKRYYENSELWKIEKYGVAEQQRVATIASKIPSDVQSLIDVGCGNGIFLEHLSHLKERTYEFLIGADRSMTALQYVKCPKVLSEIDRLPFLDNAFDAVSCMEVIEHLPQAIYYGALNELCRIAKRYILISVPFNENLRLSLAECNKCCCRFNPNYHLRSFDHIKLQHLFDNRGFKCNDIFFIHPQRVMPLEISMAFRPLGFLKRAVLRQPQNIMPDHAVCPACGYSPDDAEHKESNENSYHSIKKNSISSRIRSLLSIKSSWRWIGAVYERQ